MNFREEPDQSGAAQPPVSSNQNQSAPVTSQQSPIAGTPNSVTQQTNPEQPSTPPEAPKASKKPKLPQPKLNIKLPKVSSRSLKRYAPILAVVAVLLIGIGIWQQQKAADTNKWKKVSDYHSRAEYQKAADLLKDSDPPKDEKRLAIYAQTMLATRQLDRALAGYEQLYEANGDIATKLVIGNIYNEQKKYKEAEDIYREVITKNKSNVQAYVNLATLHKLQGQNKQAVQVAKQAVEANAGSVVLLELQVSMLLDDKSNPDYQAAVEALRKANPQDPLLEAIKQN